MKGFSLKKPNGPEKKTKLGGFSLKKKQQLSSHGTVSSIKPSSLLGEEVRNDSNIGKKVEISSIDEAITSKNDSDDLDELVIIPKFGENTWEKKRQKALDRLKTLQTQQQTATEGDLQENKLVYGINILPNDKPKETTEADNRQLATPRVPLSMEEQARKALLSNNDSDASSSAQESSIVIPQQQQTSSSLSDTTLGTEFERDLATRPESTTAEGYKKIPVSKFGLAMLKGMGYKGDSSASRSNKNTTATDKGRVPLLGLGAKASGMMEDASYRTSSKNYVPVVLVDSETGDRVDDEEDGKSVKVNTGSNRDRSPVREQDNYRVR